MHDFAARAVCADGEAAADDFAERRNVGRNIVKLLRSAAREAGVETVTNRVGSMFTTFFTDSEITDWPTAAKSDRERYGKFFHAMLNEGVYLAPSQFEAAFISTAHTDELLDKTIEAARKAFRVL